MKKMIFAAAIAQEKRNDMPTQGMNTLARERDYQAISERLSRMVASRNRQHREATCTQGLLPWQKIESSG